MSPAATPLGNPDAISYPLDVPLQTGWTLTGAAFDLGRSASAVCAEIEDQGGDASLILRWTGSSWQTHKCGVPLNDFDVEGGSGIFVRANSASVWEQSGTPLPEPFAVDLATGWNLVTIPAWATSRTAADVCDQVNEDGGAASLILRWTGSSWQTHKCGVPLNDFDVVAGQSIFVRADATSIWTIE